MAEEIARIHQAGIFVMVLGGYFQAEGEKKRSLDIWSLNMTGITAHTERSVCQWWWYYFSCWYIFCFPASWDQDRWRAGISPCCLGLLKNRFRNVSPTLGPQVVNLHFFETSGNDYIKEQKVIIFTMIILIFSWVFRLLHSIKTNEKNPWLRL